jgi:hypothetical protein
MTDLTVVDEEYNDFATQVKAYGKAVDELIEKYVGALDTLTKDGAGSGNTHDNLVQLKDMASKLKDSAGSISFDIARIAGSFVTDIDAADSWLY